MKPSEAEIDAAFREEEDAFKVWAKVRSTLDTYTLEEIAARKRLVMARSAKQAIIRDVMNY